MKTKKEMESLIAALAFALSEAHQVEIDNKHYGDKTCSYCDLIAEADGII